jgi:hypothetical protein
MLVGDRADPPLCRQLVEPFEREGDVPILLQAGAIEIDRNVANQQLLRLRVRRDDPVIRIAPAKRHLTSDEETGRRHNRYSPLR